MAKVRTATLADVPALVQMGAAMHAESPRFSRFDFDPAKTELFICGLITGERGLAVVAEEGAQIVGMLGALAVEHFFGHALLVTDVAVYVAPSHRGGSTVLRLIHAFEDWGRLVGAIEGMLGVSTEVLPERTSRLYENMGYRLSGYIHLKDL